jgi:hypothetical protein
MEQLIKLAIEDSESESNKKRKEEKVMLFTVVAFLDSLTIIKQAWVLILK